MSILADAVHPHVTRGLLSVRGTPDKTLDDLIGRKSRFYPSYQPATQTFELDFLQSDGISDFLACGCARFASASFQTYLEMDDDLARNQRVPWALVRAYYGAFYAGHSILRALGESCSHIDPTLATTVRNVLSAYSVPTPFSGGLYATAVAASGSTMSFECLSTAGGGSHEVFWKLFIRRLEKLEKDILSGPMTPVDSQRTYLHLNSLRNVLERNAGGGWLSAVRNAIQYRHAKGVWSSDFTLSQRDKRTLSRISCGWRTDPLLIDLSTSPCGELGPFVAACTFLVGFCRDLLALIGERGRRGRSESFAALGPLRLLKTYGV